MWQPAGGGLNPLRGPSAALAALPKSYGEAAHATRERGRGRGLLRQNGCWSLRPLCERCYLLRSQ